MPRLALLGDLVLGRLVNESLREKPPSAPWGGVLALLRESDWRFCNLECVISDLLPERLPAKLFLATDRRPQRHPLLASGRGGRLRLPELPRPLQGEPEPHPRKLARH